MLFVVSLSFLLMAGSIPVAAAEWDPSLPVNNKKPPTEDPRTGGGDPPPPPPGPSRKIALGVAMPDGNDMAALDALTASIGGNTPAVATVQSAWGNENTKEFPTETVTAMASRGITPMIWWTPMDPNNPLAATYSRHKNISDGLYDTYIHRFAKDAAAYGGLVLLRFAHEANSSYFPWSIDNHDNSDASYIKAWRHVHNIFQFRGATNVKWVWNVALEKCSGCNPYDDFYPGDAYVDFMAFSAYNWGAERGNWISMYDAYRLVTNRLSQVSSKPIMVAETGSTEDGGDKAAWIRDGYPTVYQELPLISTIIWTNVDLTNLGHPDWRINSSAASLAAYREIASDQRFHERNVLRAGRTSKVGTLNKAANKKKTRKAKARKTVKQQAPRVRKGTAVVDQPKETIGTKATGVKSRSTKKRKKREPPETLDTFQR